jgi:uncharacterized membrane protein
MLTTRRGLHTGEVAERSRTVVGHAARRRPGQPGDLGRRFRRACRTGDRRPRVELTSELEDIFRGPGVTFTANVSVYLVLKFLHVLLAIIAIGFNASYPIWLARARQEPEHALSVLRGIKALDDRFANPAYGLLLVLGLGLTFMAGIPLTTFWIAAALVLYAVLVIGGLVIYSPTLKGQIAALEAAGPTSPDYVRLSQRGTIVGILLAVDVVIIVFLMAVKPTF